MSELELDTFKARHRPPPRFCACGRRINRTKDGEHDECAQCRAKPPPQRLCECGRRILTGLDNCSVCRSNATKRWCPCGNRIYDGQATCTVCRHEERQTEIIWEQHHGIMRAVYVKDVDPDNAYPLRGSTRGTR